MAARAWGKSRNFVGKIGRFLGKILERNFVQNFQENFWEIFFSGFFENLAGKISSGDFLNFFVEKICASSWENFCENF